MVSSNNLSAKNEVICKAEASIVPTFVGDTFHLAAKSYASFLGREGLSNLRKKYYTIMKHLRMQPNDRKSQTRLQELKVLVERDRQSAVVAAYSRITKLCNNLEKVVERKSRKGEPLILENWTADQIKSYLYAAINTLDQFCDRHQMVTFAPERTVGRFMDSEYKKLFDVHQAPSLDLICECYDLDGDQTYNQGFMVLDYKVTCTPTNFVQKDHDRQQFFVNPKRYKKLVRHALAANCFLSGSTKGILSGGDRVLRAGYLVFKRHHKWDDENNSVHTVFALKRINNRVLKKQLRQLEQKQQITPAA